MRARPSHAVAPLLVAAGLVLTGCAGAPEANRAEASSPDFPVEVTSCGYTSTITTKPENAVTMNQGATEIVLALGAEDQLAGTAYLDDSVSPKWQAAYDSVAVLSEEYPSKEALLAAEPDFVYASYGSAFDQKVAGTQPELDAESIASYVSPFGCEDQAERPETSFDAVWDEIASVGTAFGVKDRAAELRTEQQATLDALAETEAGRDVSVFWYDSGTKAPYVGAGQGGPQLILDAVGAANIFAKLDGGWAEGNWEDVIAADPDVIVLADASWDAASTKQAYLEKDPVLSQLRAVKEGRFVTIPFSESTPGVRLVDGAASVSEQLAKLTSNG